MDKFTSILFTYDEEIPKTFPNKIKQQYHGNGQTDDT